jgi:hypothetical protein
VTRRDWTRTVDLMVRTWGPKVNEAALSFEAAATPHTVTSSSCSQLQS